MTAFSEHDTTCSGV